MLNDIYRGENYLRCKQMMYKPVEKDWGMSKQEDTY